MNLRHLKVRRSVEKFVCGKIVLELVFMVLMKVGKECPSGFYGQDCTCNSKDLAAVTKYKLVCSSGIWKIDGDAAFGPEPLNIMNDTLFVTGNLSFSSMNLNLSISDKSARKSGKLSASILHFKDSCTQISLECLTGSGQVVFAKYNKSNINESKFLLFDKLKYCRDVQFSITHQGSTDGYSKNSIVNITSIEDYCSVEKSSMVVLLTTYCAILALDVLLAVFAVASFYIKKLRTLIWYPKLL